MSMLVATATVAGGFRGGGFRGGGGGGGGGGLDLDLLEAAPSPLSVVVDAPSASRFFPAADGRKKEGRKEGRER
jgi:hypothetical protein